MSTISIKHSDLKLHWYFTCEFRFFAPFPSNVKRSLFFFLDDIFHRQKPARFQTSAAMQTALPKQVNLGGLL